MEKKANKKSDKTITLLFKPLNEKRERDEGDSILGVALKAGIGVGQQCGGAGRCGRCKIRILSGTCSPPDGTEKNILTESELKNGIRLACRTYPLNDIEIEIFPFVDESFLGQTFSPLLDVFEDISYAKYILTLPLPTLTDNRDDLTRLKETLRDSAGFTPEIGVSVLESLPEPEKTGWHCQAFTRENRVVSIKTMDMMGTVLAMDIGSTRLAAYLIDPLNRKFIAAGGADNPQLAYGTDIISRLTFASRNVRNGKLLRRILLEAIGDISVSLCGSAGLPVKSIMDTVFVGNTAMQHLLMGFPVERLMTSPYVPVVSEPIIVSSGELDLPFSPGSFCRVLPNIAGFIGSDHVAMLLAVEKRLSLNKTVLCIDIGTNTEICLSAHGELSSVSAPSGPAFEGWHIVQGMRADNGAIDTVSIENGNVVYSVLGGGEAKGMCGSGIVDAVASLYREGIIDYRGRFKEHPLVKTTARGKAFALCPTVSIYQKDIEEFMLAKGSIAAGIEILLRKGNVAISDINEIIIAGAFGVHINTVNAKSVGLFPDVEESRIFPAGNAAGAGAIKALLSEKFFVRASELGRMVRYIELAAEPLFKSIFPKASFFPK